MIRRPPRSTLFPLHDALPICLRALAEAVGADRPIQHITRAHCTSLLRGVQERGRKPNTQVDRKSTRLNSSHSQISYAVFCLKKKKQELTHACAHRSHVACTCS